MDDEELKLTPFAARGQEADTACLGLLCALATCLAKRSATVEVERPQLAERALCGTIAAVPRDLPAACSPIPSPRPSTSFTPRPLGHPPIAVASERSSWEQ